MRQVSYGPLIMSFYTGFFNVRRGWQSLNTGPRFYWRLIRRTGWLWIYTSCTTDGCPFKPKKLSVPFLYPGVPAGLTPFRGLVPLGQRNLVPILPPAHPLGQIIREILWFLDVNWRTTFISPRTLPVSDVWNVVIKNKHSGEWLHWLNEH